MAIKRSIKVTERAWQALERMAAELAAKRGIVASPAELATIALETGVSVMESRT